MLFAQVVPALIDASEGAQMIVVGSRGRDAFGPHRLGSVSLGVLHHAHRPVAVVHDPEWAEHEISHSDPVLVGIDCSPASEAATALAFDEASLRSVPLVALHACSDVGVFPIPGMDWRTYRDEGDEVLGERLAGWQERYPNVQVHRRLVCDVPARWLVDESKEAQLVVLGSHGRGGYAGVRFGSVSSGVAQAASVPVIVVRAPNGKRASIGGPPSAADWCTSETQSAYSCLCSPHYGTGAPAWGLRCNELRRKDFQ